MPISRLKRPDLSWTVTMDKWVLLRCKEALERVGEGVGMIEPKVALEQIKRLQRTYEIGGGLRYNQVLRKTMFFCLSKAKTLEMRLKTDPQYVRFSITSSAKGGVVIEIGSCIMRVPKYLSVCHPLLQMVLFAHEPVYNTFFCLKTMVSKTIITMSKASDIFASPIENGAGWICSKTKSKSPNVGTIPKLNPGESIDRSRKPYLPVLFNLSASQKTSSTISATPQSGDNGSILKLVPPHRATTDAKMNGGVNNDNMLELSSTIGSVECGKGASNTALTAAAFLHDQSIVNNPGDERTSNPCSIGATAITSSAETCVPIAHELPGTELQFHRNSGSGMSILWLLGSPVNQIAKASMDVISGVVKSSVTICTKGAIGMKNIVPKYFSGIYSCSKSDCLHATRIYMTTNGKVQNSANLEILKKRRTEINEEIIFDSGAENHVTGNFALLSRVTAVRKGLGVVSASGHFMAAKCSGSLVIDGIKLNDVLFVPGVTGTIISVSKLDDLDYSMELSSGKFLVRDARTGDLVGECCRSGGLYEVVYLEIPLDRAPVA